jgi:glucose/arabinose dehydrogenase
MSTRPPRRGRPLWPSLLLGLLGLLCAFGYFGFGVNLNFVLGGVRAALAPRRSLTDIAAPDGVRVTIWARDLHSPTSLAFGPDGRLYVAELGGEVAALADHDRDGVAETRMVFASQLNSPLGLVFYENDLFIGRRGGVTRARDADGDGVADDLTPILDGLPAGRHQTDGIAFGPDGRMYIGQGSTSDRGETGVAPLEASILVAERDGSGLRVFASGVRNPYDLAFYPGTDQLFATDNGRDVPPSGVPDELNLIVDGGHYGWPDCWGAGQGSNCAGALFPVAEFQERSSANGLAFYTGDLFPEWQNHAFVALYGSLSGDPAIGRKVQRVALTQNADGMWRGGVFDFASGFDRPLDVAVGPDGAVYVADFGSGVIYRLGK